jgi:hypothetical protein
MTTTTSTFQSLWDAPMSSRGWLTLRDNDVRMNGMETGTITLLNLNEVTGLGLVGTFHETGHSYWAMRTGPRGYAAASVFTAVLEPTEERSYRYVRLNQTELYGNDAGRAQRHATVVNHLHQNAS